MKNELLQGFINKIYCLSRLLNSIENMCVSLIKIGPQISVFPCYCAKLSNRGSI
jgi:hypothetical protein